MFEELIADLERKPNKYVVRFGFGQDGSFNIEFAEIGPLDEYVISVTEQGAELCRQTGRMEFESVRGLIPDSLLDEYRNWLEANLVTATCPGVYKVSLDMPVSIAEVLGVKRGCLE